MGLLLGSAFGPVPRLIGVGSWCRVLVVASRLCSRSSAIGRGDGAVVVAVLNHGQRGGGVEAWTCGQAGGELAQWCGYEQREHDEGLEQEPQLADRDEPGQQAVNQQRPGKGPDQPTEQADAVREGFGDRVVQDHLDRGRDGRAGSLQGRRDRTPGWVRRSSPVTHDHTERPMDVTRLATQRVSRVVARPTAGTEATATIVVMGPTSRRRPATVRAAVPRKAWAGTRPTATRTRLVCRMTQPVAPRGRARTRSMALRATALMANQSARRLRLASGAGTA
jgi:hypothetical protein